MEKQGNKPFAYRHARSEVSSDVVVFGYAPDMELHLLLVHKIFPDNYSDGYTEWALPGHFIHGADEFNENDPRWEYGEGVETLEDSVRRALRVEVGVTIDSNKESVRLPVWEYDLDKSFWEYLPPKTDPERDNRGKRVISLPVMVFVKMDLLSDFQKKVIRWVPISQIEKNNPTRDGKTGNGEFRLPFDHADIYYDGIERLRQIVHVQPIGLEILEKFTIIQLQKFYEAILGGSIDKSSFRKWLLDDSRKLIEPLDEYDKSASNRPAQYFRFNETTYNDIRKSKELGFNPTVTKKQTGTT